MLTILLLCVATYRLTRLITKDSMPLDTRDDPEHRYVVQFGAGRPGYGEFPARQAQPSSEVGDGDRDDYC